MVALRTKRLVLRQWRDDDLEPFAELNADTEVMHHFPSLLTRGESDTLAARERRMITARGWGLWAVEVIDGAPFIGFVGLSVPRFEAHFTPAVEIGWRLAQEHWGQGYATEGARSVLAFGFDELGLDEIVSFTTAANQRSQRVMERIGMTRDPADDFAHPLLEPGHPLRPHVLYRLSRATWERAKDTGAQVQR
jgi:RimJ/RimL family protein N-acetyltransferase